jgi:acyl carrier protein
MVMLSRGEILMLIRDNLAEITAQPSLHLTEATTADDVLDWDSINHVKLIISIEQELNTRFESADIEGLKDVGGLIGVIQAKMQA